MRVHLMAVGGTGMGALAGLLKAQGHEVTGCDTSLYPPMSDYIAKYGVTVGEGYSPDHLEPPPDLVVIGNAVHSDNSEAIACQERGIPYLSMAEAIGRFAVKRRHSLVVAGTHGKTTTSALCGWLLEAAGLKPNLIVGGIAANFDSSYMWGGGEWTVLEGDEYETAFFDKGPKFLHYDPSILLLNNIEMDHLDNFRDLAHLETAFVRLFGAVRENGTIVAGTESPSVARLLPQAGRKVESFGLAGDEVWTARDISYDREGTRFRLVRQGRDEGLFLSPMHGAHNLRNAVGALAACATAGAELERLREGLKAFLGVKRRQEVLYQGRGVVVLDDFAHHPSAIAETIGAFRQRFAPKRLVACFEPRSFTCQTDLHQESLAPAFRGADEVCLGPIHYSAKIPAEKRLNLERVVATLVAEGKVARVATSYGEVQSAVLGGALDGTVIAFFSSGAFGGVPVEVARRLAAEEKG